MTSDKSKKYLISTVIIALAYLVLTYVAYVFDLSSREVQVRFSESLNTVACFTGAAVPGMTIGCIIANWATGGGTYDIVVGSFATFLGVFLGRQIAVKGKGKFNILVPVPTIIVKSLIIPSVLIEEQSSQFSYDMLIVAVLFGEIVSAGLIGMFVYFSLLKIPYFKNLIPNAEQLIEDDSADSDKDKKAADRAKDKFKADIEAANRRGKEPDFRKKKESDFTNKEKDIEI